MLDDDKYDPENPYSIIEEEAKAFALMHGRELENEEDENSNKNNWFFSPKTIDVKSYAPVNTPALQKSQEKQDFETFGKEFIESKTKKKPPLFQNTKPPTTEDIKQHLPPPLPQLQTMKDNSPLPGFAQNLHGRTNNTIPKIPEKQKPKEKKKQSSEKEDTKSFMINRLKSADIFLNEDGVAFITILIGNTYRDIPIKSDILQKSIKVETYNATQEMPSDYEIREVISYAEGLAHTNNIVKAVYNRFHFDGNRLVLDLCNGKDEIVYLDSTGMKVSSKGMIKFYHTPYMKELPVPDIKNGDIEPLLQFLPIKNKYDVLIILTWLISAMDTCADRPILCLYGTAGSGKSTLATILKSLLDPSKLDLLSIGESEKDIGIQLQTNAIVVFDNEANISRKTENTLCRASTGGAQLRRELYSDGGSFAMNLKRSIIITGVNIPYEASDLMDRTLPVELTRFMDSEYKSKDKILKELETYKSVILGGIVKIFHEAIKIRDTLQLDKTSRMTDYYRTGCAISKVLGYEIDTFVEAMKHSKQKGYNYISELNPLPLAITSYLDEILQSTGDTEQVYCANDLYKHILNHASSINVNVNELPRSSSAFTRKLRNIVVDIEQEGWSVHFSNDTRVCRQIIFIKID